MILKNPELSFFLSKRDDIIAVPIANTLFLNSKLIVPEKSLKRMFEAIPGYHSQIGLEFNAKKMLEPDGSKQNHACL